MADISVDEDGSNGFSLDFSQLLDLPNATTAADETLDSLLVDSTEYETRLQVSSLNLMLTKVANSFLQDNNSGIWDLPETTLDTAYNGLEEPDYGKFENVCTSSVSSLSLSLC